MRPLPDSHPEFLLVNRAPNVLEFRVENKSSSAGALLAILPVLTAISWALVKENLFVLGLLGFISIILVYNQCTQVLWESVIITPTVGLELETRRGIFGKSLFTSHKCIPLSNIQDVIINEGLRRWDVRYYLAALTTEPGTALKIQVAYENLLPRFPVLHKVYLGIHERLLNTEDSNTEENSDEAESN